MPPPVQDWPYAIWAMAPVSSCEDGICCRRPARRDKSASNTCPTARAPAQVEVAPQAHSRGRHAPDQAHTHHDCYCEKTRACPSRSPDAWIGYRFKIMHISQQSCDATAMAPCSRGPDGPRSIQWMIWAMKRSGFEKESPTGARMQKPISRIRPWVRNMICHFRLLRQVWPRTRSMKQKGAAWRFIGVDRGYGECLLSGRACTLQLRH